jgi:hypothetical protein
MRPPVFDCTIWFSWVVGESVYGSFWRVPFYREATLLRSTN